MSTPFYGVVSNPVDGSITRTPHGRDIALALPLDVRETGELRSYKMVFPFLPPSKNVYDSWMWPNQQSAKQKWVQAVVAKCEELDIPKGVVKIGLSAVLVFPSKSRTRDIQNYAQTLWHFVPDALQRPSRRQLEKAAANPSYVPPYGLIPDDGAGRIQFGSGGQDATLGIRFAYDLRSTLPKDRRMRTHLAIAFRVNP